MTIRTPWDDAPKARGSSASPMAAPPARPRGRRPTAGQPAAPSPGWLYHHLDVSGPTDALDDFAAAARGPGLIPWALDGAALEEDVFNLAVRQPAAHRGLTVEGCRLLARQFRARVEARHARMAGGLAVLGQGRAGAAVPDHPHACPLDLHVLLPVPPAILRAGATDRAALAWLAAHWGTSDPPRQVACRPVRAGRRLPAGHGVRGYGFFTAGETPHVAVARLAARWASLRWSLRPRPD